MLRAAESSQLLRNRELWMGWNRCGLPAARDCRMLWISAAILARIGLAGGRYGVVSGSEEGGFPEVDHQAAALQLQPDLAALQFRVQTRAGAWPAISPNRRAAAVEARSAAAGSRICFTRSGLVGGLLFSCLPRPSTMESVSLNCPCSSASLTDSETARALLLSALRGGEHHHEEGEQQGDEIGVGYQPAFVILVRRRPRFRCIW